MKSESSAAASREPFGRAATCNNDGQVPVSASEDHVGGVRPQSASGAAFAPAAALLFNAVAITPDFADEAKIHCEGVNSCKGQSA